MDIVKKEKKNKKGKVVEKTINMQPKNGKINISEVNKLYKKLLKNKERNFIITGMGIDGYKTLKSKNFMEDDLKYSVESYFQSYTDSKAIYDKFSNYFNIQITFFY
jgi:hypothetical protein